MDLTLTSPDGMMSDSSVFIRAFYPAPCLVGSLVYALHLITHTEHLYLGTSQEKTLKATPFRSLPENMLMYESFSEAYADHPFP